MGLQIQNKSLSSGIFSSIARYPIKRDIPFRYNTSISLKPSDYTVSKEIIFNMHKMSMHPGNYDWKGIVSYGGAIYSALEKVDRPLVNRSFPKAPENLNISIEMPISWGGTIFKTAASLYLMTKGLPVSDVFMLREASDFWKTTIYLGLNAIRNAISDLSSKHGFDIREWKNNLHHIKLDKLTDSMLVTAFCFPILFAIKEALHEKFGGTNIEPLITSATISLVDASLQYVTRRLRGFDKSVAIKDTLRPIVGDFSTLLLSMASKTIMSNSFLYLLSRKVFAELYSGYIEAKAKRREKEREREDAIERTLNIENYKLPDKMRYAMAAINLVYLTSVKSVTKWLYSDILKRKRFQDKRLFLELIKVHKAMKSDDLIKETALFLFPFDDWAPYREQLISDFKKNREIYNAKYLNRLPTAYYGKREHLQNDIS